MRYYCSLALLSVAVLLAGLVPPPAAEGQMAFRPSPMATGLAGTWINQETGGFCYVYNLGRGFVFVSDFGERIQFAPVSANQLRSVRVNATIPDILVTVDRDALGRLVLMFESPGRAAGYWAYAGA